MGVMEGCEAPCQAKCDRTALTRAAGGGFQGSFTLTWVGLQIGYVNAETVADMIITYMHMSTAYHMLSTHDKGY